MEALRGSWLTLIGGRRRVRSSPPEPPADRIREAEGALLLRAEGVTRRHPSGKGVFAIDLSVGRGEVVSVLGPNGSGKTTLLRALATVDPIQAGSISWFGRRDRRDPAVRRALGVVLDDTAHFEAMSGYQNAWFFARRFGVDEMEARERLNRLFTWSGLAEAVHRPVEEYSLGMRRRLALVESLCHQPRLLLLDEPTLGLDWAGSVRLIEMLRRLAKAGVGMVLSTNDVHLAEQVGGYVVFLDRGRRVGQGTVAELLGEVAGLQRVELDLRAPVPLRELSARSGVEMVGVVGRTVRLLLAGDASPVDVLRGLDGHAHLLAGVRVDRPHLGDAFLLRTGRPLEEETEP
jgi:ABC-type multidrug transport system ATPase subunit